LVSPRTRERYGELLASYVMPTLGQVPAGANRIAAGRPLYPA
jgi:hypothetical protein